MIMIVIMVGSGGGDLFDNIVWLLLWLVCYYSCSCEGAWDEVIVTVGRVSKEERWFVVWRSRVYFELLLEWEDPPERGLAVDE